MYYTLYIGNSRTWGSRIEIWLGDDTLDSIAYIHENKDVLYTHLTVEEL